MRPIKMLLAITCLILLSLACSLNVNVPITTDIITSQEEVDQINIPLLEESDVPARVTFGFGAGEMHLSPGSGDYLIDGIATFNVPDFKPEVSISDDSVKIETGNLDIDGIPNFSSKVKNSWDFALGTNPINLTIKAGAYVGDFQLGGLSITDLHISDGASDVEVNFEQPNLIRMETLRYETGASNITLHNLSNANFNTLIFQSGAGDYELDFSGQLQHDSKVFIETGLSNLTIIVPENTDVDLDIEGGLTSTTARGNWIQSGNQYRIEGDGPTLHINVEMNAGNLILDNP